MRRLCLNRRWSSAIRSLIDMVHLHWNLECKTRAPFGPVPDGEGPFMGRDDEAAEIQAQSRPSARGSRNGPVRLEQRLQRRRIQPAAFVFHGHNHPAIRALAPNRTEER